LTRAKSASEYVLAEACAHVADARPVTMLARRRRCSRVIVLSVKRKKTNYLDCVLDCIAARDRASSVSLPAGGI